MHRHTSIYNSLIKFKSIGLYFTSFHVTTASLVECQLAIPFAAAAVPPLLPGSCAHPHHPPLLPAGVPEPWRRRYLALPDPPAPDSACCCCPPTADPGSFPKASLLPPGPSLGCLRRRRAWHSAERHTKKRHRRLKYVNCFLVSTLSLCLLREKYRLSNNR